jgi:hypothetical protein
MVQNVISHMDLVTNAVCGNTVQCLIEKESTGIMDMTPIYRMYTLHRKFLLAARKTAGGFSDYAISTHPKLINMENQYFVARLSANLFSTHWVLRDAGYIYTGLDYVERKQHELAAIVYKTNILGLAGPREFQVVVPEVGS